ncbi:MAG: ADP compounds hydrolase NudE, partial [Gammaproteobacteria bacterium]
MTQPPKIMQAQIVAQTRIFRVEELALEFSNGEHRVYERLLSRRPAVLIVPILNGTHVVLIREYSAGVDKYELTFPKGLVEPHEALLAAAERELQEETGYAARQLMQLREFTLVPGYMMHKTTIFLAQDLYHSPLPGDEPEPIEVVTWPLDDIAGLLAQPDFSEGRSIASLWMALRHIGQ